MIMNVQTQCSDNVTTIEIISHFYLSNNFNYVLPFSNFDMISYIYIFNMNILYCLFLIIISRNSISILEVRISFPPHYLRSDKFEAIISNSLLLKVRRA